MCRRCGSPIAAGRENTATPDCPHCSVRAFSDEVDAGSAQENATK
jgi:DNA-directed RNA polymerase subunit RPC12/RpoP